MREYDMYVVYGMYACDVCMYVLYICMYVCMQCNVMYVMLSYVMFVCMYVMCVIGIGNIMHVRM